MGRTMDPGATRRARSFAPAHLTGFFAPRLAARDPRGRGSVGAGLVLEAGVRAEAEWTPGRATVVEVRSPNARQLPISTEVARRLVGERGGRLELRLVHELPIARGFGMSAAGALATGLAVGQLLEISERRSVEVAHLAELFGGGGLGGVAAIRSGGIERRLRAGVPPWGRVLHRPAQARVYIGISPDRMASPKYLLDPGFLERVERAAAAAAPPIDRPPTLRELMEGAERFTDALGLGPVPLDRTIAELRSTGAWVAQAMIGPSFYAVPPTAAARRQLLRALERRHLRAIEVGVAGSGAASEQNLLSRGQVRARP